MQISSFTPAPIAAAAATFRPSTREVGLLDLHGVGFFSLRDSQTGYGRSEGYATLADARRAAAALTSGPESPAAGIFRQQHRFFLRSLLAVPAKGPHDDPAKPAPGVPANPGLLHVEGHDDAHFAWVRSRSLEVLVDGSTRIWAKDAHHPAPRGTAR